MWLILPSLGLHLDSSLWLLSWLNCQLAFPKVTHCQHNTNRQLVWYRAQYHSITSEYFNLCVCVCVNLSSGQLKQDNHRMSVVFMGGGSWARQAKNCKQTANNILIMLSKIRLIIEIEPNAAFNILVFWGCEVSSLTWMMTRLSWHCSRKRKHLRMP